MSTHRFLHQRADLRLDGGGQLLDREGGRPHGAFVEVRRVVEAERRVPRFWIGRLISLFGDAFTLIALSAVACLLVGLS